MSLCFRPSPAPSESIAGLAIDGIEADDILTAKTRNRARNVSFTACPLTEITRHVRSQPGTRGLAINFRVARVLAFERISRNGDCASWTEIACFNVSSKTGSPVALLKSANTRMSSFVSFGVRWKYE